MQRGKCRYRQSGRDRRMGLITTTAFALVLAAAGLFGPSATAQSNDTSMTRPTLSFDAQLRYRLEVDGRYVSDSGRDSYGDIHLLRTRLGATFRPIKDVEATLQIQDSRQFGAEANTLDGSAPMFDLHQGFVRVQNLFDSDVNLQVGRQELAYANERLLGAVGWSNVGRSFDAVRAGVDGTWGKVDLFGARLASRSEIDTTGRLFEFSSSNLYGAWSSIDLADGHYADLFALLDNDTKELEAGPDSGSARHNRFTAGGFIRGDVSPIHYEGEFAWQAGSMTVGEELQSISALLASAKVVYVISRARVGAFYTLLSGDDNPGDGDFKAFNTLFATNHKFYGYMDFFPRESGTLGLQDIGLTTRLGLGDDASIALDGHLFLTAVDAGGENAFGKEADATFKYGYRPGVTFFGGASLFVSDELMKSRIGDTSWWGFLGLMVNFNADGPR